MKYFETYKKVKKCIDNDNLMQIFKMIIQLKDHSLTLNLLKTLVEEYKFEIDTTSNSQQLLLLNIPNPKVMEFLLKKGLVE